MVRKVSRGASRLFVPPSTGMRRITTFRSTMDRIYDGGPITFKCDIPLVFYELIQCVYIYIYIYLAVKTQHNFIMH